MPDGKYKWNEAKVDLISLDKKDEDKINMKLITDFFKALDENLKELMMNYMIK